MKQAAFLRRALALLGHDVRRETRQAQALAGSLLYLVAGVFAAQLLLRPVGPAAWLTFYWLLVLFVSIYTVSRSFLGQSRGLHLYYRVSVPGVAWWLTKVMTGTLMLWVLMGFCAVLMALWMGYPIQDTGLFVLTLLLGAPMLVTVLTLVSAMSQGASQPAQLMPVLGFPLLVPGLLLVHRLSKLALDGLSWDLVWTYAGAMVGLNLMLLALGVLLFPFLWRD
jgi:heme exporter protein B